MERRSVLPLTRQRARLLEKACIHDTSSTHLWGSSARRSGESTLPACTGHCISDGGRRTFGPRVHAGEHRCPSERFSLPVCRWAVVLAWPEVGFTGHEVTVPTYGRSAE